MKTHHISGIPVVVEGGGTGTEDLWENCSGILTNRDVRFAKNPEQPISDLMTKENLITVDKSIKSEDAKRVIT